MCYSAQIERDWNKYVRIVGPAAKKPDAMHGILEDRACPYYEHRMAA
jgi:hypothetical protein